jgi:hypothetical protein
LPVDDDLDAAGEGDLSPLVTDLVQMLLIAIKVPKVKPPLGEYDEE